jgi:hypothetical protein
MKRIFLIFLTGVLIAGVSTSCAMRNIINSLPIPEILKEEKLPHRVAILPFANTTSTPQGGETVRKMFYNFFSSLNYIDLELVVIDDTLKGADLYQKIAAGEDVSPQKLGQLLAKTGTIAGSGRSDFRGGQQSGKNICAGVYR